MAKNKAYNLMTKQKAYQNKKHSLALIVQYQLSTTETHES